MMKDRSATRLSRYMSYILRHHARSLGLDMDPDGSVDVEDLLVLLQKRFGRVGLRDVEHVVATSDKQRFELIDGRIRATYGHSLEVTVEHPTVVPPEVLFHGTTTRALDGILRDGLKPMGRRMVHLSGTVDDAIAVGRRRQSDPVVLVVHAGRAHRDGVVFSRSGRVFLAENVPPGYIGLLEQKTHDGQTIERYSEVTE